ncbi:MAG: conjugal transfer protein TraX [Treponema sp.]|jgi:hypothetical protein|nr:conjugal transfer protein TraX [Treponema sp.]
MDNTKQTRVQQPLSHRWEALSNTNLKIIGITLMVMDHLHQMLGAQGVPAWFNWFGRPVVPIFLFLCAEGFAHTSNRPRYMLRLLAGSAFMSAASFLFSRYLPVQDVVLMNNIFSALFMSTWYMWMIDSVRKSAAEKKAASVAAAVAGMLLPFAISVGLIALMANAAAPISRISALLFTIIPNPIGVEGGVMVMPLAVLFYVFRRFRLAQIGVLLAVSALSFVISKNAQWIMAAAAIPIALYNRRRGGGGGKRFFYIFYPAHIYLLYVLAWALETL